MNKIAYSYVRFSSKPQEDGNSVPRQDGLAQAYALEHGLVLDETLNMRDLGVSAFRGKNASKDGALGMFLEAIKTGRVKSGSFFLIEDIDRLSRLPVMEALEIFQTIIANGVIVVTVKDRAKYCRESLKENWTPLLNIVANMGRAYGESARKSVLLIDAWRAKQEATKAGVALGNNAPLWIIYKDGKYQLHPERAEIVERIFQMSVDGRGREYIAKQLNAEGTNSFKPHKDGHCSPRWGTTSIQRLLSNRAVLGEYTPRTYTESGREAVGDPRLNYYPAVIDELLFQRAQEASNRRHISRQTRQPTNFNIWSGIAKCLKCDSAMHMVNKGVKPKGHTYLICAGSRRGLCNARAVRLDASELVFRQIVAYVGDLSMLQTDSENHQHKLQALTGSLSDEQKKLALFVSSHNEYPSPQSAKALQEQNKKIEALAQEIAKLSESLAANSIVDKAKFLADLDLISYKNRDQINGILKRLKVTVAIGSEKRLHSRTGRWKLHPPAYTVFQDGKRLVSFVDDKGQIQINPLTLEQQGKMATLESGTADGEAAQIMFAWQSGKIDAKEMKSRLKQIKHQPP